VTTAGTREIELAAPSAATDVGATALVTATWRTELKSRARARRQWYAIEITIW